ncbi:MAG TPA: B12-binding domain-containing protein [Archangium sp.]|uniref:B12-binding domain-containing protein n=1 Tax=Archangium sp. TaxID=1872627 RepID=UPI002ED99526
MSTSTRVGEMNWCTRSRSPRLRFRLANAHRSRCTPHNPGGDPSTRPRHGRSGSRQRPAPCRFPRDDTPFPHLHHERILATRERARRSHRALSRGQLAGNLREALRLLDKALARGVSITALQCHVIQVAQREVGEHWRGNRIGVAHEHLASAISQVALAHLFSRAQPEPSRGICAGRSKGCASAWAITRPSSWEAPRCSMPGP